MKLSIITISFNPGLSLERTIHSVLSQNYPDMEWIVVDGGSTDGALEFYEKIRKHIFKFVSEPDKGIADAMNKGLRLASGDAVIYMNAGDEFANGKVLEKIVAQWHAESYDWATGDGLVFDKDGNFLYERPVSNETSEGLVRNGCRIMHAATVVKRSTLIEVGGFSTEFKSSMDYELWLRLISNRIFPQLLSFSVAKFYLGGVSGNLLRRYSEERHARKLHGASRLSLEIKLAAITMLKQIASPMRRFRVTYLLKEWLKL